MIVRGACALLILAATLAPLGRATAAAPFSDFLVQPPKLAPPGRGSVSGALAHLGFEPGSLSRGDFRLPLPIELPNERGGPLVDLLPSYSPDSGLSEWGIGWRVDLSIRRFAMVGP
jgi:hypothetical protein